MAQPKRPRRLRRGEQQQLTRAQLLDAAERVFAREGFQGASVAAIAEEAGYSHGAIYSNFNGKEDRLPRRRRQLVNLALDVGRVLDLVHRLRLGLAEQRVQVHPLGRRLDRLTPQQPHAVLHRLRMAGNPPRPHRSPPALDHPIQPGKLVGALGLLQRRLILLLELAAQLGGQLRADRRRRALRHRRMRRAGRVGRSGHVVKAPFVLLAAMMTKGGRGLKHEWPCRVDLRCGLVQDIRA